MSAGPADGVLDIFKSLVFDQLVKMAISQIVGLAPFLAFGPIAFIVGKVVTYVAEKLYEGFKDYINIELIILKNAADHRAFVDAQVELKKIALAKGIDSEEFRSANAVHKKAFADLMRYDATR